MQNNETYDKIKHLRGYLTGKIEKLKYRSVRSGRFKTNYIHIYKN